MTDLFDSLIGPLLGAEGGYSNNPDDSGGETNWGVTVAVARKHGYAGPMKDMSREDAIAVYRGEFWSEPKFDQVALFAPRVAGELFDCGVNSGTHMPAVNLQRCLNVLNQQEKDWPDLATDGSLGPASLSALKSLQDKRGVDGTTVLVWMLKSLRGTHYIEIAEKFPKNESFEFGWFLNRIVMR